MYKQYFGWVGLLAGAMLFGLGCAGTNPNASVPAEVWEAKPSWTWVSVDTQLSQEQMAVVRQATDMWRHDTNGLIDMRPVQDYDASDMNSILRHGDDIVLMVVSPDHPMVKHMDKKFGGKVLGFTIDLNPMRMYLVVSRIKTSEFLRTVEHELGHANGLKDVRDPKALMASKTNGAHCLNDSDAREICRVNKCSPNHIITCDRAKPNQMFFDFERNN